VCIHVPGLCSPRPQVFFRLQEEDLSWHIDSDRPSVLIGRGADCHVQLPAARGLSRQHARLAWNRACGCYELECLGKNPIGLNGATLARGDTSALDHLDAVQIADHCFWFLLPRDALGLAARSAQEMTATRDGPGRPPARPGPPPEIVAEIKRYLSTQAGGDSIAHIVAHLQKELRGEGVVACVCLFCICIQDFCFIAVEKKKKKKL
jgi:hypothetical protein